VVNNQAGNDSFYSIPLVVTPREIALSDSEKTEALSENLEAQFQTATDTSVPADIETVDAPLRAYFLSPASEPQLTTPEVVHEAIRGLKVSKAPGPNGIPNRALKHLPRRSVSILARIFNAFLCTHLFTQTWKHARVISILKPGKGPALPSSYRPIILLDRIGKLFENTPLARILHVVNEGGLMQDEQFGFRPRHSTSLQLPRPFVKITRNIGGKGLTKAVFLDVAKAFFTVRIDGLLYKLTHLKFVNYIVYTFSSYLRDRTFEASFQTATSFRRGRQTWLAQGD